MAPKARPESTQQELPFGVRIRRRTKLSPETTRMLMAGGVLLVGLLMYVWQHIQVVRIGYQIERLRAGKITLVQEGKALNVELSRLRSLAKIEELVRGELGMVNPVPGQVILVDDLKKEGG